MPALYFYDWDCYTNEDLELSREAYEALLDFCFSHSEIMSFIIRDENIKFSDWLEQFRIPDPERLDRSNYPIGMTPQEAGYRYYKVCPEIKQWMLESVGGMFEWIDGWGYKNPEDPCFYRVDGSVLFFSTIHEGELKLFYRDDEDITELLPKARWKFENERIYPH